MIKNNKKLLMTMAVITVVTASSIAFTKFNFIKSGEKNVQPLKESIEKVSNKNTDEENESNSLNEIVAHTNEVENANSYNEIPQKNNITKTNEDIKVFSKEKYVTNKIEKKDIMNKKYTNVQQEVRVNVNNKEDHDINLKENQIYENNLNQPKEIYLKKVENIQYSPKNIEKNIEEKVHNNKFENMRTLNYSPKLLEHKKIQDFNKNHLIINNKIENSIKENTIINECKEKAIEETVEKLTEKINVNNEETKDIPLNMMNLKITDLYMLMNTIPFDNYVAEKMNDFAKEFFHRKLTIDDLKKEFINTPIKENYKITDVQYDVVKLPKENSEVYVAPNNRFKKINADKVVTFLTTSYPNKEDSYVYRLAFHINKLEEEKAKYGKLTIVGDDISQVKNTFRDSIYSDYATENYKTRNICYNSYEIELMEEAIEAFYRGKTTLNDIKKEFMNMELTIDDKIDVCKVTGVHVNAIKVPKDIDCEDIQEYVKSKGGFNGGEAPEQQEFVDCVSTNTDDVYFYRIVFQLNR